MITDTTALSDWLHSPKTWIAGAVLLFTLGGSATMFHESLLTNESIIKETHAVLVEHETHNAHTSEAITRSSSEQQQLLKEIVRVMKVNCLSSSKDDVTRRACMGVDHQ